MRSRAKDSASHSPRGASLRTLVRSIGCIYTAYPKDVPFLTVCQLAFNPMRSYVIGVDGCKSGWLACRSTTSCEPLQFRIFSTFVELTREYFDAKCIAVDIPIGLRDDGAARRCDVEARVKLGPGRRSSVFPAPARCLLENFSYA